MSIEVRIPGEQDIVLRHLVLDVNGTLTDRGRLIAGASAELRALHDALSIHVATADTFGSGARVAGDSACRERPQRRPDARSARSVAR